MNVALVSQPIGEVVNGNDSVNMIVREHARRLAADCNVVVYGAGDERVEQVDGVPYHCVPLTRDEHLNASIPGRAARKLRPARRPHLSSRLCAPFFWRSIARQLSREQPDIVHVHNFSQFVPMAVRAAPDASVVLHMHCEWLGTLSSSMLARRLALVDSVLGVSSRVAHQAAERFPQYAARCHALNNGVDIAMFEPNGRAGRPAAAPLRLLYVGRISPEKGLHVLLDAIERLVAGGIDVELTVVGAQQLADPAEVQFDPDPAVQALAPRFTPEYESSVRSALSPAARSRVTFAGFVAHDALPARYAQADVFVLPSSWHEPFCLSVVEAMASGIPVIATSGGGQDEIVEDGVSGLLVRRNDAQALADAIGRLASDTGLRHMMGTAARARAVDFSWDAHTGWLLNHYRELRGTSERRELDAAPAGDRH